MTRHRAKHANACHILKTQVAIVETQFVIIKSQLAIVKTQVAIYVFNEIKRRLVCIKANFLQPFLISVLEAD